MKNRILFLLLLLAVFAGGLYLGYRESDAESGAVPADTAGSAAAEREILYWVAPMDPNYRRDKPGKSPMGMDLVPVYADEAGDSDAVKISPWVVNNLGVRTEQARLRPLWRRIEATGYVAFDETHISHINTRVAGWIVQLAADAEGERISKGDLLFELYSPELVNAQKEYLQAFQRRDGRLLAGGVEKLRALGMIPAEIEELGRRGTASENIRIFAPQDGIVTTLGVREGMYIQPNTTIMSLADLSTVWLQAEVFESQADWVAPGQAAEARLEYMPGAEFTGQVDYVYPVLDPVTRTLRVRLRFDNPDERLKPNMYARVSIYGRLKPSALSIPREALIPAPGRDRVVVAVGDGAFHVHEVLTGLESGEYVEILAGIEEGDEVVTSAQFLIDSEASLAGSIERLEADVPMPPSASPGVVFASGRVEEINRAENHVRISHGPIEQLGWPSMTMFFDVKPGLDISGLKVGQDIRFALEQEHAGEYMLAQVFDEDSASTALQEVQPGNPPGEAAAEAPAGASPSRSISARAVVRDVMPQDHELRLEHEAIKELEWPPMTMNFRVSDAVDLDRLEDGQKIHFRMIEKDGAWIIDQVHVMGYETTDEDRGDG